MGKMKVSGIIGWVLSILVLIALVSVGSLALFDINILLEWIAFNNVMAYKILAGTISVLGIIGLIALLIDTFK